MNVKGYIGIDFGTASSHFAYSELADGPVRATEISLEGAGKNKTTTTAVLWGQWPADSISAVKTYGDIAIEEWCLAEDYEREKYRLATAFKPDLASSDTARLDAACFLQKAYLEMRKKRTPPFIGDAEGMPVIVGVPAQISEEHRKHTVNAASKAGFGRVECLAEPLGALAYHLAHGQITEEDVDRGVLVVDFGGGTLDIAWLDQDGVREPWGNTQLGGRLFDDLFFQWIVEQNNIDLSEFSRGERFYSWLVKGREIKEAFSFQWRNKYQSGENDFIFKKMVGYVGEKNLGAFKNATIDEFKERVRAYQPSITAREYFKLAKNTDFQRFDNNQNVDLIDWIRKTITSGPNLTASKDYSTVILTGGSSSWLFMPGIVSEIFGISEDKILCSSSPERTIGEGLAIYNVLRHRHKKARKQVNDDLPALKDSIKQHVSQAADKTASKVASVILKEVMTVARSNYSEWRESGGSLNGVEVQVRAECQRIPIDAIAREHLKKLSEELDHQVFDIVKIWCQKHGFTLKPGNSSEFAEKLSVESLNVNLGMDIGDSLGDQVAAALTVIGGIIAGTLLGGGGTALLMSGPLGWIIGAGLGGAAIWRGKDAIKEYFCDYHFEDASLTALQTVLQPFLLNTALENAEKKLRELIEIEMQRTIRSYLPVLEQYANTAANIALKKYDILEKIS